MISSTVRFQLMAFVVVTVLGVGYVSIRYLDAGALLGAGPYPVTLQLTDSGGIFTGADVSYRGVTVGRVGPLRLTSNGVDAQLETRPDAAPIPASRGQHAGSGGGAHREPGRLRSVPLDSLRTVVDELGTGFAGTGPQLQNLLDGTDAVTRDAITALPQVAGPISSLASILEG
ncbi:MAG: hypothetical protein DLM60_18585 [Pseudonocardiales bacterium]|nr:MlaD family protein [Actinomycetota bacterium]PZS14783.1 MAG: hypothetical protein DLM60_18585 [Pseudonocardiales bacterium]